jgi:hypothetical protein
MRRTVAAVLIASLSTSVGRPRFLEPEHTLAHRSARTASDHRPFMSEMRVISQHDGVAGGPLPPQYRTQVGHRWKSASCHFRDSCAAAISNNLSSIYVPVDERPQPRSMTTCSLHILGSMGFLMYRLDEAYLFERRQVAGAVPNAFLKAREKAASEL